MLHFKDIKDQAKDISSSFESFRMRINEQFLKMILVVPLAFQKPKSVAVSVYRTLKYERTTNLNHWQ